jgi:predicted RNase H-like HicB family nuclease
MGKQMHERSITVRADWDPEAGVWFASSDDICGLSVEADSLDALRAKVMGALEDLVEMNGFDKQPGGIPVHFTAEETLRACQAA